VTGPGANQTHGPRQTSSRSEKKDRDRGRTSARPRGAIAASFSARLLAAEPARCCLGGLVESARCSGMVCRTVCCDGWWVELAIRLFSRASSKRRHRQACHASGGSPKTSSRTTRRLPFRPPKRADLVVPWRAADHCCIVHRATGEGLQGEGADEAFSTDGTGRRRPAGASSSTSAPRADSKREAGVSDARKSPRAAETPAEGELAAGGDSVGLPRRLPPSASHQGGAGASRCLLDGRQSATTTHSRSDIVWPGRRSKRTVARSRYFAQAANRIGRGVSSG